MSAEKVGWSRQHDGLWGGDEEIWPLRYGLVPTELIFLRLHVISLSAPIQ